MKHRQIIFANSYLLAALSLFLFMSCNSQIVLDSPQATDDFTLNNNCVSYNEIQEYISKSNVEVKSSDYMIEPILYQGDTVLYLVNYSDGWEILSADKRAPRHIAMAETGHFDVDDFLSIPLIAEIFDCFVDKVSYLRTHPEFTSDDSFVDSWQKPTDNLDGLDWEFAYSHSFGRDSIQNHLTVTRWGQGSTWNTKAPYKNSTLSTHCFTGCVPVAGAQLLYYLHSKIGVPVSAYGDSYTNKYIPTGSEYLVLQNGDVTFDSSTYSSSVWGTMPLTSAGSGSFSAVSTLMVQLGLYISAKYYTDKTSAYSSSLKNALQNHFGISSTSTSSIDFDIVSDEVYTNQMPVYLQISRHNENGQWIASHAVLADAFKIHLVTTNYVYRRLKPLPPNPSPFDDPYEYMTITETVEDGRYVGINWGWDSSYMGSTYWFSTDAISWTVGARTYDSVDYMIYGFDD